MRPSSPVKKYKPKWPDVVLGVHGLLAGQPDSPTPRSWQRSASRLREARSHLAACATAGRLAAAGGPSVGNDSAGGTVSTCEHLRGAWDLVFF